LAAFATDLNQKDLNQHLGLEGYTSNALKLFMEHLDQQPQSRLLDVGPVCQENVRFFASRVSKHYVCDMFIRLDRYIRKGEPVSQIWKELDYHPESFDGILVWELADRLDEQDVNRCDQIASSETKSFVVGQNYRIYLRPQPHLDLPLRGRQNRDVLSMMVPFIPAKSFICRPGFMEFLFQRE
jgi:hypothetical protein